MKFITILIMVLSFPAFGGITTQDMDLSGLSETAKSKILTAIEAAKAEHKESTSMANPAYWAELGKGMGVALANMAAEMGVAADKILESTAGKIALIVIVVKILDVNVLGIPFGIIWYIFMIPLFFHILNRVCSKVVEIHDKKGNTRRILKLSPSNSQSGYFTVTFIILIGVGMVTMFG